jgi:hypothetical protein
MYMYIKGNYVINMEIQAADGTIQVLKLYPRLAMITIIEATSGSIEILVLPVHAVSYRLFVFFSLDLQAMVFV